MGNDAAFMRHALCLARRNLGQTWPNPAVGAVVARGDAVLGTGWTARGGRPHAEPQALAQAGSQARGATLYVTLEPCAHHGQSPPCTEAIINAGISRAVIACRDPHAEVNGKGIHALQEAGIPVTEQVCEAEARELNAGFFSVVQRGRPYVALKLATSMDGKIATVHGESKWITGEAARAHGHALRSEYDAILTGSGTLLADAPLLTCRLPGLENRSPVRAVLDRRGRAAPGSQDIHLQTATLPESLHELAARGITRVLVEAGGELSTAFLREGLVDRLYWFRSPRLIGAEGASGVGELNIHTLAESARWRRVGLHTLGNDILEVLDTCSPAS